MQLAIAGLVDERGDISRTKTIVDIDDTHVGRAGIEHAEKGGETTEGCSVADAGGHGDDRSGDETANDRRQRAFHAGAYDEDTGFLKMCALSQQTMQACDAHVSNELYGITHELSSDASFFRDGQIAGTGADYSNEARTRRRGTLMKRNTWWGSGLRLLDWR